MKTVLNRQLSNDYETVEKAIRYIEYNQEMQPPLSEIASYLNCSEFYLQKVFSRWVGISPKRFLQFLTKEYAKELLWQSRNLLDVTYEVGLSSPGRLHDLFIHCEALTPGEYKKNAAGVEIVYGFSHSPFGLCMIAQSPRGVCALQFIRNKTKEEYIFRLQQQWPEAVIVSDSKAVQQTAASLFPPPSTPVPTPLHLHVKGTNFQIKVWEALTRIPPGDAVTYQDIARHIGHEGADRAVGSAVGKNPVAFLIPCHRVIRKSGIFGNYGGGRARKKAMIGWEAAKNKHSTEH